MDQDTARHIERLTERLTLAELRAANLEFTLGRLLKYVTKNQPPEILVKFLEETATIAHKSYTHQGNDPSMKDAIENFLDILKSGTDYL